MELLDSNNTITFKKFKCLRTNQIYEVVQTECTGRYINNAIDTLVRSDGLRKSFARAELRTRFSNIEGIPEKDYLTKKEEKTMTQAEIIELVRDIHPEVDHEGVDIVYDNGNYDVDVRFTSWDCLFTVEIYSKSSEIPLELTSRTMTELFDYTVDLHTEYMRDLVNLEETRDYLDIYEK